MTTFTIQIHDQRYDPGLVLDLMGFIPDWLARKADDESLAQLFQRCYPYGGWQPQSGFRHKGNYRMSYPGDPIMSPIATLAIGEEILVIYPHSVVGIFQADGAFEIARMD